MGQKLSAKSLRRLDRAWAAALRALTTLRLSYPSLSIIMGEGRMGFKIFINGMNLHTGRFPNGGLKRSQRVSKCHETLGAERIRALQ